MRLRQPLKRLAGERAEHALQGSTVIEALRELERANPGIRGWVLDERGVIRQHVNVFVNGERGAAETAVGDDDRAETAVGDDDRVDVLPAISGGAP